MTVRFRQIRGGVVVTAPMAGASLEGLSTAYPWRTFRWYKGQKHYLGWYWVYDGSVFCDLRISVRTVALLYADFDLSVRHIVAQPGLLTSSVKGVARQHIPDYLLITKTGPLVADVKPRDKVNDPLVADTLTWTRAAIEGRGWTYEVWSEPPTVSQCGETGAHLGQAVLRHRGP